MTVRAMTGRVSSNIAELVGDTPIVELSHLSEGRDVQLFAKLESLNPGGSVKDRIGGRDDRGRPSARGGSSPVARRSLRRPAATPGSRWRSSARPRAMT